MKKKSSNKSTPKSKTPAKKPKKAEQSSKKNDFDFNEKEAKKSGFPRNAEREEPTENELAQMESLEELAEKEAEETIEEDYDTPENDDY